MKFEVNPDSLAKGSGSGKYLKLKDGDEVRGVFRGDPYTYYAKWENKSLSWSKEEQPGYRFRFRINFVQKVNGEYVPKVLEQGPMVYRQMAELAEDWELESTVVKLKRRGEGLDTEYSLVVTNDPVTDFDALKAVELLDVEPEASKPKTEAELEDEPPF